MAPSDHEGAMKKTRFTEAQMVTILRKGGPALGLRTGLLVDSGGREYRLLSEHRPSMPNERGPGLGYDSPAACIP